MADYPAIPEPYPAYYRHSQRWALAGSVVNTETCRWRLYSRFITGTFRHFCLNHLPAFRLLYLVLRIPQSPCNTSFLMTSKSRQRSLR